MATVATAHVTAAGISRQDDHARLLAWAAALQQESVALHETARAVIERSQATRSRRRGPATAADAAREATPTTTHDLPPDAPNEVPNGAARPSAALLEALDMLVAFDGLEEAVAATVARAPWMTDAEVVRGALAEGVPGILAGDLSTLVADLEALVHRLRAERRARAPQPGRTTGARFRPDLGAR